VKSLSAFLLIAACLLQTACVTRYVRATPPEALLVPCPVMPEPVGDTVDAVSVWGADMIDWGHDCASKHDALRTWHKK